MKRLYMRKLFGHLQSRSQEMSIKRLDPMIKKKDVKGNYQERFHIK